VKKNPLVYHTTRRFGRKLRKLRMNEIINQTCHFISVKFSESGTRKISVIVLIMGTFSRNMESQFLNGNKDNFILYLLI
jgi:hypothetical protein